MLRRATTRTFAMFSSPNSGYRYFTPASHERPRILITGALGQIGTDLTSALRSKYGVESVIATDIRKVQGNTLAGQGPFQYLDVLDYKQLEQAVVDNNINWIVHLSAIMSVLAEAIPQKAMDLNINAVRNVLEIARVHRCRTYAPSTIAVFNKDAGQDNTPDDTILNPRTIYGVTKVFLEQLGVYYQWKYGVDFRCMRYPGMIAAETLPGGGTTDYAVHMYHYALKGETFTCPVNPDEALPMMYMPDCVKATLMLLEAPEQKLTRRVYNLAALSFTPEDVRKSIKKYIPGFEVKYERGLQQDIASTWPNQLDDSNARRDWGWSHDWSLDMMTRDMLKKVPEMHDLTKKAKAN
jgi:threonine 3-dehydrogenase